jgi:hypothetical protein
MSRLAAHRLKRLAAAMAGWASFPDDPDQGSLVPLAVKLQRTAVFLRPPGRSYRHKWMRIFGVKAAASALIFLDEHGIDSYDEPCGNPTPLHLEFHRL